MATARRYFETKYAYHIYNCGVEKRRIFLTPSDYSRFLEALVYYKSQQTLPLKIFRVLSSAKQQEYLERTANTDKLRLRIIAYCLMPNHYHILVRATENLDVAKALADVQNSYTMYFNKKNDRLGHLFQGRFKSKRLEGDGSVLNLSRYIHLNPVGSAKTNPNRNPRLLELYQFSSYRNWLYGRPNELIDSEDLNEWLSLAGGSEKYKSFVTAGLSNENLARTGIEKSSLESSWD